MPPGPFSRLASVARSVVARVTAVDPFDPRPYDQPPAKIPPASYATDQPIAPPPGGFPFREGYHDHTFIAASAPAFFGGVTLEAARGILEQHDIGSSFYGSSILAVAMTRFPEVYSALEVRTAPAISLPRVVDGGARGLGRIAREEVEAMLAPRRALRPSPYFPSVLWGAIQIDLAMQGFFVLQHVVGAPDARGIRRIYTRRWPTWAVWYDVYRKTYVALTTGGSVDISNDGKFTLGGKSDIPHFQGALRPLVLPVFDASQVVQARAGWIDKYSDPKWIGYMQESIGPRTPEGAAFYQAMRTMKAPGGVGAFPHGSKVEIVGLSAEASASFKEALDSDNGYINKVLTGIDPASVGGVYKPKDFWGILRSTVGDDLAAIKRAVNVLVDFYCSINYGDALPEKDRPALDIPLPNPEADAQAEATAKNCGSHTAIIVARRAAGMLVEQSDSDKLAEALNIPDRPVLVGVAPTPVSRLDLAPTDVAKVVKVDEARKSRDLPPIGDDRGDLTISELDAKQRAVEPQGPALEGVGAKEEQA